MEKKLNLPALEKKKIFRAYLDIISVLPPINNLSSSEKDVLGLLMYYNDLYKDLERNVRSMIVNGKDTLKSIHEECGMNNKRYNNIMTKFRKLRLVEGNYIRENWTIYPDDENYITFKLCILPI